MTKPVARTRHGLNAVRNRIAIRGLAIVDRRGAPAKALFAWQKDRRRFRLESIHPETTLEEILDSTGFEFDRGPDAKVTPMPSAAELALLRSAVAREIGENYPEFAHRLWAVRSS